MGILEVPGVTAADAQSRVDARTVVDVVAVSLAGTLALNKLTQVHADAAPRTMLLPTGAPKGTVVTVEKSDTTANAVTVSGIIRGVSASVALTLAQESIQFVADTAGSWNPSAGHKTLASIRSNITGTPAAFTSDVTFKSGRPWVDPITYGADPTGVADSAPAFRAAAAVCAGLHVPMVPTPGSYLFTTLDAASQCFVPLTAGIQIRALLPNTVTILVGTAITTWTAVFGVAASSTIDLSGLDIQHITFDGQSAANPYPAGSPPRYAINAYKGSHLTVRNCRFQNWDGRNLIVLDGHVNGMSNVSVKDNDGINLGGATFHDHSAVYTDANGQEVSGNRMWGISTLGPTTPSNAVCPYEIHGSAILVHDNQAWNYASAGNLCSVLPTGVTGPSASYSWVNNHFYNVGRGLSIWAFVPMTDGIVEGNTFDLNTDQWPISPPAGYPPHTHYGINKTCTDGLSGLPASGNVMNRWKFRGNTFTWRGAASGASAADVAYRWVTTGSTQPASPDTDIEFSGNTVVGPPSSYFYTNFFNGMYRWAFDDRVYNVGSAGLPDTVKFRAGWYLRNGGNVVSCHFGGRFVDDISGATQYLTRLISGENGGTETIPTFIDVDMNGIQVTSSATMPPLLAALQAGQVVDMRTRVATFRAPTGLFTAGSEILETSTGTIRRQTSAPTGSTFTTQAAQSPTDVQRFTTSGTWTKPASVTTIHVRVWAGGGQGGSGAREASGTLATGGGGGGAGGYTDRWLAAADVAATVAVTVNPAASSGGAAVTVDSTVGNVGAAGAVASFGSTASYWCAANGGAAGAGGTAAGAAAAGGGGGGGTSTGGSGGASSATGGAGSSGVTAVAAVPTGGGGGGGVTTGAVAAAGAAGGVIAGGAAGGGAGAVNTGGGVGITFPTATGGVGTGGGGGGASTTGAAGAGGAGGSFGSGGGGGGASLNGAASGAGGAGAPGLVIVESYF